MEFEAICRKVDGIPVMSAHQGRIIYNHVRQTRPARILELGSAHGVSAAYMGAALEANAHGTLLSVDIDTADYQPSPPQVFAGLGLEHRVEFVRVPDSSYDWLLRRQIAECSDAAGNCDPLYDFVYIDGAHEFTIDGLAAVLVTKLLKPGGWLLLDDLDWSHAASGHEGPFPMSEEQLSTPNMREVFDLIVKQDPSYTEFRVEDGVWGWAHKGAGSRTLSLTLSEPVGQVAVRKLRSALGGLRAARR